LSENCPEAELQELFIELELNNNELTQTTLCLRKKGTPALSIVTVKGINRL